MDFGRRPGPDKPKAQMFEDCADNRRVLNAADDPHFPLTLWADQGICLVYLLDQSCPAFSKCLQVPLWFNDAGDGISGFAFSLPRQSPFLVVLWVAPALLWLLFTAGVVAVTLMCCRVALMGGRYVR